MKNEVAFVYIRVWTGTKRGKPKKLYTYYGPITKGQTDEIIEKLRSYLVAHGRKSISHMKVVDVVPIGRHAIPISQYL